MRRIFLCAASVVLCVSVVNALQTRFTKAHGAGQSFDTKGFYKANCAECHGSEADKRFNPDSPEGQMIDSILNGAKAEGSRDMPAYAEKGIDETKAKALIAYMKSIRE